MCSRLCATVPASKSLRCVAVLDPSLFRVQLEREGSIPLGPPPQAYPPVTRPLPQTLLPSRRDHFSKPLPSPSPLSLLVPFLLFRRRSSFVAINTITTFAAAAVDHLSTRASPPPLVLPGLCLSPLSLPSIWFVLVSSLASGRIGPSIRKSLY